MSDYTLTAAPALGGFSETIAGTLVEEVTGYALVSIAVPRGGGEAALGTAMNGAYGAEFPETGKSTMSADGQVRFMGMTPDQAFAIFAHDGDDGDRLVAGKLGETAYYTLQSDNWVMLRLSGPKAREALQRICQLDLDPGAFPEGSVGRTVMEHMGATVLSEGNDSFLLISAWSTAHSFLHAVQTSVSNVS